MGRPARTRLFNITFRRRPIIADYPETHALQYYAFPCCALHRPATTTPHSPLEALSPKSLPPPPPPPTGPQTIWRGQNTSGFFYDAPDKRNCQSRASASAEWRTITDAGESIVPSTPQPENKESMQAAFSAQFTEVEAVLACHASASRSTITPPSLPATLQSSEVIHRRPLPGSAEEAAAKEAFIQHFMATEKALPTIPLPKSLPLTKANLKKHVTSLAPPQTSDREWSWEDLTAAHQGKEEGEGEGLDDRSREGSVTAEPPTAGLLRKWFQPRTLREELLRRVGGWKSAHPV